MATKAKPAAPEGVTRCRVLVTGAYGEVDSVVELSGDVLSAAVEAGQVDSDPAAVAYADSLAQPVVQE